MNFEEFLNLPLSRVEAAVSRMTDAQRYEMERQLAAVCEKAARLASYCDMRHGHGCGDQCHESAVKESNRVVRNIRKALGFSVTRDVHF